MPLQRILVTGSSGLLGANLASRLSGEGFEVVAQHHLHPIRIPGAQNVAVDLAQRSAANALVAAATPGTIIHVAALTNVDQCEIDPGLATLVNVAATRNLADAAKSAGSRFVYISTDSVFDGRHGGYVETDETAPLNVYARTKLEGERAASEVWPHSMILRTNIFGWNAQAKSSLAEWFLGRASKSQPTPGFEDVVFSPILVNDLADCLVHILRQSSVNWTPGVYHLGGADAMSKYDFGRSLCRAFALDPELIYPTRMSDVHMTAARPGNTSLSSRRASEHFGLVLPRITDGIARLRALQENGFSASLKGWMHS